MTRRYRDHYPRRPGKVNRPPERKPSLSATTPKSRKQPPTVRYVPIVKVIRERRRPASDTSDIEFSFDTTGSLVSFVFLTVAVGFAGYFAFFVRPPQVFFPHDYLVLFWSGVVLWLWRLGSVVQVSDEDD